MEPEGALLWRQYQPPFPVLSQLKPVHTFTSSLFKIHISVLAYPRKWSYRTCRNRINNIRNVCGGGSCKDVFHLRVVLNYNVYCPLLICGLRFLLFIHNFSLCYRNFMTLNDIDMLFPTNVNHMVMTVEFNGLWFSNLNGMRQLLVYSNDNWLGSNLNIIKIQVLEANKGICLEVKVEENKFTCMFISGHQNAGKNCHE
jgi:hypothetical protein